MEVPERLVYFDFRTYFQILRLVLTDKPSPRRWLLHFSILTLLSVWALANAVCLQLDRLLFPAIRKVRIRSPVFIVGNARSGTTLFQRLLCGDEERFVHFRAWEILFPSLLQKKILRACAAATRWLLPGSFARLVAWEQRVIPSIKTMRPLGIDEPEEDEFLLMIPFASATLTVLFPYLDRLQQVLLFDRRPAPVRRRVMAFYRGCVSRQLLFHGGERTLVSKNPSFVTKLQSLAEEFPDAKFVYLIRNPFETIPSLIKLLRSVWEALGIDSDHIESSTRELVDGCMRDYEYALAVLGRLPPSRCAIVEYQDLVADPKTAVEKVYEQLGLSISPAFEERLRAERSRQKRYHRTHAYSLAEFGLSEARIAKRLAPLLERFGFRPEDAPKLESREML